jgi:predicted RND superfamily exporter protein
MRRALALLVILVVSGLSVWQTLSLRFDTSIEVWFLEKDPDLISYRAYIDAFESDQIIVIAYEDDELWTPAGLAFLDELTTRTEDVAHVQYARSITNSRELISERGSLTTRPFYDRDDPPQPKDLRQRILASDLLRGSLVSDDGTTAAVILTVEALTKESAAKMVIADELRALTAELGAQRGVAFHIAGATMMDDAFFRHTRRDLITVMPAMALMIILAMLVLFRTWRALLLPLSVVGLACLWVLGVMGTFGLRFTITHSIIFPLLMGVGIASSIHVLSRTITLRRWGESPHEAARNALRYLLAPCFFTAMTTVAGLCSLLFTSLKPIREFGALASGGVFAAFLLTYGLGPVLLPMMSDPQDDTASLARMWQRWDAWLLRLAEFAQDHGRTVLVVSAVILGASLIGLKDLHIGNNPLEYYKTDDPVRIDLAFVDARLSGTGSIEVLVDTGVSDGVKQPATLHKLQEVEDFLAEMDGVGETLSFVDLVQELRRALRGGAEAEARIPDSAAEVSQLLLLIDDPVEIERLVDFDYRRARIHGTIKLSDAEMLTENVAALEQRIATVFTPPATASATGSSKLIANMNKYLLRSTLRSMAGAFVIVLFFMTLALRSVRLGLFSMIPNLLPIGIVLGLMGWTGIRLDPGTTMIAAVALGLVVDDTLHFLHQFRDKVHAGENIHDATRDTLMVTGRAIAMTSVILCGAFWLLLFASFIPNIYFGLLCGTAIALALVCNLVVLTAALAVFKPRI